MSVDRWAIQHSHHLDDGFQTVLAMARHEGIDAEAVREELHPAQIDVANMGGSDLVEFITKHPHRLHDLTKIVMTHPRGELTGMLETACGILGYTWSSLEWVKGSDAADAGKVDIASPADAYAGGSWPFPKSSDAAQKKTKAFRKSSTVDEVTA